MRKIKKIMVVCAVCIVCLGLLTGCNELEGEWRVGSTPIDVPGLPNGQTIRIERELVLVFHKGGTYEMILTATDEMQKSLVNALEEFYDDQTKGYQTMLGKSSKEMIKSIEEEQGMTIEEMVDLLIENAEIKIKGTWTENNNIITMVESAGEIVTLEKNKNKLLLNQDGKITTFTK